MKNVIKISISGLAFTLEEDGYVLLDRYLGQLRKYYSKQQNGMEVVEGIEERIAELLRERMSTPEEVVSKELVQEVMAIMGKPEDIEEIDSQGDGSEREQESSKGEPYYKGANWGAKTKRKLYRNIEDKVLGGVCSGIAAYFNMEPLLLRVIFVVLALFSSIGFGFLRFWSWHNFGPHFGGGSGWVILAYIILWIVIPAAKTVAQKCEMRGERPDFSGIQDRVKRGAEYIERNVRNASQHIRRNADGVGSEVANSVGRIITFCVGVLLIFIAMPVLVALPISLIFSASWLHGVLPSGVASIVAFNGSILWIKLLIALVVLLPFVGMFYGGIALIFNLRPQRVRPGLIIFATWLLSVAALVVMLIIATRPYYGGVEEAREEIPLQIHSDTLYVHYAHSSALPNKNLWMEANSSEAFLAWFEGDKQNLKAIVYPHIRIIRVDSTQPLRIRLTGRAAGRYVNEAITRAEETIAAYTLQDSLFTLLPDVYSSNNKWQGNMSEVTIYLPQGKQVVLAAPFRHHFDRSSPRISKGAIWKNRRFYPDNLSNRINNRLERKLERWERKWERFDRRWND